MKKERKSEFRESERGERERRRERDNDDGGDELSSRPPKKETVLFLPLKIIYKKNPSLSLSRLVEPSRPAPDGRVGVGGGVHRVDRRRRPCRPSRRRRRARSSFSSSSAPPSPGVPRGLLRGHPGGVRLIMLLLLLLVVVVVAGMRRRRSEGRATNAAAAAASHQRRRRNGRKGRPGPGPLPRGEAEKVGHAAVARVLGGVPRLALVVGVVVGLRSSSSGSGRRRRRRSRLLTLFGCRRRCDSIAASASAISSCACRLHDASSSESCEQQRRKGRFGGLRGGGSGAAGARFSIVVGHRKK